MKNSRRKEVALVASGILLGVAIAAPAAVDAKDRCRRSARADRGVQHRWKQRCDWSAFPTLTLPEPEVRHYNDQYGDDLFVRNVYEVRRMVCTIYNALGEEPSAWRNDEPLATVSTVIPPEYEAYTAKFWPWRESELVDLVHSRPNSRYYVDAFDFYHDGAYQYTRYLVLSL